MRGHTVILLILIWHNKGLIKKLCLTSSKIVHFVNQMIIFYATLCVSAMLILCQMWNTNCYIKPSPTACPPHTVPLWAEFSTLCVFFCAKCETQFLIFFTVLTPIPNCIAFAIELSWLDKNYNRNCSKLKFICHVRQRWSHVPPLSCSTYVFPFFNNLKAKKFKD